MKAAGLAVYPVDHLANRFTPKVPTFTIDLSDPGEVKVAEQLLRFTEPKAVHLSGCAGRAPVPGRNPWPCPFVSKGLQNRSL